MNRKKMISLAAILLAFTFSAFAQEKRSEVSIQGTGFFTKDTNTSFLTNQTTDSGGFLAGYRRHLNRWVAVDANYGWTRNTQKYFASGGLAGIRSNVHEATGDVAFTLPFSIAKLKPYVLAGGGALIFDPRDTVGVPGIADTQAKPTFMYGGGVDYNLMRNVGLRFGYRGFVYKVPDYGVSGLNLDKVTHSAQPSAGLVFRF